MRTFKTLVIGGIMGLSLLTMACSSGPSDQQLKTLNETRQAAEAAEKQVQELQQQKQDLQAELDSKKQDLERAQAEKARVQQAVKSDTAMSEGGMK